MDESLSKQYTNSGHRKKGDLQRHDENSVTSSRKLPKTSQASPRLHKKLDRRNNIGGINVDHPPGNNMEHAGATLPRAPEALHTSQKVGNKPVVDHEINSQDSSLNLPDILDLISTRPGIALLLFLVGALIADIEIVNFLVGVFSSPQGLLQLFFVLTLFSPVLLKLVSELSHHPGFERYHSVVLTLIVVVVFVAGILAVLSLNSILEISSGNPPQPESSENRFGFDNENAENITTCELLRRSGVVFHDKNRNSVQDTQEPGIPDVLVRLQSTEGYPEVVVTTDLEGKYDVKLPNPPAGIYVLSVEKPSDFSISTTGQEIKIDLGFCSTKISFTNSPESLISDTLSPAITVTLSPTSPYNITITKAITLYPSRTMSSTSTSTSVTVNTLMPTLTKSLTQISSKTPTINFTPTLSVTPTAIYSNTNEPTLTLALSTTPTRWVSPTGTITLTALPLPTNTPSLTSTLPPSYSPTSWLSTTITLTPTILPLPTHTSSLTPTLTLTPPHSPTPSENTITTTPTSMMPTQITPTLITPPSPTYTQTPQIEVSATPTSTVSPTQTYTLIPTPIWTTTPSPTIMVTPTPTTHVNDEGCTPGYWKNHLSEWAITGYNIIDNFDAIFSVDLFDPDITLKQSLYLQGGDEFSLARQGTAALLNAAHPSVDYPLSVDQVIGLVQMGELDQLADHNEAVCPLH